MPTDAYLRLHLLSHRLIRPHGANLDGLFGVLANVAWTSVGPSRWIRSTRCVGICAPPGKCWRFVGVDKIPRMTDYVVATACASRTRRAVRLGAHLSPGTTVLHEGFLQFQRWYARRVHGRRPHQRGRGHRRRHSDIGGGASIMGTVPGGGKQVVSIGKRCLLGANTFGYRHSAGRRLRGRGRPATSPPARAY